jgi:hypothetical protein
MRTEIERPSTSIRLKTRIATANSDSHLGRPTAVLAKAQPVPLSLPIPKSAKPGRKMVPCPAPAQRQLILRHVIGNKGPSLTSRFGRACGSILGGLQLQLGV